MRKVKHGTPIHEGPSLCESCRCATHIRGVADSQDYVICGKLDSTKDLIRFKVRECSAYDDKSRPSLTAMRDIAWTLATDKSGRKIGFLSPDEFDRRVKAQEVEPPSSRRPLIDPRTGDYEY